MEILIRGDNMKRQVSISIFCAILLIVMVWLYIKFYNDRKLMEKEINTEEQAGQIEESITISQEYISYKFYIKNEDGRIVVYSTKTKEWAMETGIEVYTLPEDIKENLDIGIFFETEEDLYDFLESYSS